LGGHWYWCCWKNTAQKYLFTAKVIQLANACLPTQGSVSPQPHPLALPPAEG
jgi:hypothetical protein